MGYSECSRKTAPKTVEIQMTGKFSTGNQEKMGNHIHNTEKNDGKIIPSVHLFKQGVNTLL